MSRVAVSVINQSEKISDSEVKEIAFALQHQVNMHFQHAWGSAAAFLSVVPKTSKPDPESWWLLFLEDSDQAGALGYHDVTPAGLPVGKVFVAEDLKYKAKPSITASHELLEMLGDPLLFLTALDPRSMRLYAYESADAVEADELGYEVNGVPVSDFVLPVFFDPTAEERGVKEYSHGGNVHKPFELAKGGYLSYLDLRNLSHGWQQETARGVPADRMPGQRQEGFPPGSRRERRKRYWETGDLERSTAHA